MLAQTRKQTNINTNNTRIMIITIEGKQGEGKSALAREVTFGKTTLFILEADLGEKVKRILAEGIDFLVVDEVKDSTKVKLFLEEVKRKPNNTIIISQTK